MLALAADLLTFSRLIFAGVLVWLGLQGPDSLPAAVLVGILAWTTDALDGWSARHARTPTRLAPADFAIDRVLNAGMLAYLVLAGFVHWVPAAVLMLLGAIFSLFYRRKAVDIVTVRLVDLLSAVVIFKYRPLMGVLVLVWGSILGLIYRRRVAERAPHWFGEMAQLAGLRRGDEKSTK